MSGLYLGAATRAYAKPPVIPSRPISSSVAPSPLDQVRQLYAAAKKDPSWKNLSAFGQAILEQGTELTDRISYAGASNTDQQIYRIAILFSDADAADKLFASLNTGDITGIENYFWGIQQITLGDILGDGTRYTESIACLQRASAAYPKTSAVEFHLAYAQHQKAQYLETSGGTASEIQLTYMAASKTWATLDYQTLPKEGLAPEYSFLRYNDHVKSYTLPGAYMKGLRDQALQHPPKFTQNLRAMADDLYADLSRDNSDTKTVLDALKGLTTKYPNPSVKLLVADVMLRYLLGDQLNAMQLTIDAGNMGTNGEQLNPANDMYYPAEYGDLIISRLP